MSTSNEDCQSFPLQVPVPLYFFDHVGGSRSQGGRYSMQLLRRRISHKCIRERRRFQPKILMFLSQISHLRVMILTFQLHFVKELDLVLNIPLPSMCAMILLSLSFRAFTTSLFSFPAKVESNNRRGNEGP